MTNGVLAVGAMVGASKPGQSRTNPEQPVARSELEGGSRPERSFEEIAFPKTRGHAPEKDQDAGQSPDEADGHAKADVLADQSKEYGENDVARGETKRENDAQVLVPHDEGVPLIAERETVAAVLAQEEAAIPVEKPVRHSVAEQALLSTRSFTTGAAQNALRADQATGHAQNEPFERSAVGNQAPFVQGSPPHDADTAHEAVLAPRASPPPTPATPASSGSAFGQRRDAPVTAASLEGQSVPVVGESPDLRRESGGAARLADPAVPVNALAPRHISASTAMSGKFPSEQTPHRTNPSSDRTHSPDAPAPRAVPASPLTANGLSTITGFAQQVCSTETLTERGTLSSQGLSHARVMQSYSYATGQPIDGARTSQAVTWAKQVSGALVTETIGGTSSAEVGRGFALDNVGSVLTDLDERLGLSFEATRSLDLLQARGTAMAQDPRAAETARQIAQQIGQNAAPGSEQIVELKLNPEELGSLRFRMSLNEGVVSILIQADRGDTQDLMRRHIDQLQAELTAMGFGEASISFGDRPQSDHADEGSSNSDPAVLAEIFEAPTVREASHGLRPAGVDIRV